MRIIITGRHYNVSPSLKNVIEKKLERIKFFYDHILMFHVIIEKRKNEVVAEITFNADGKRFFLQKVSPTVAESIDLLIDKLEVKVKKHKEKMKNHKVKGVNKKQLSVSILDKLNFLSVEENPSEELEMVKQFALNTDEMVVFEDKDSGQLNLLVQDNENHFSLFGQDKETNKWIKKVVYLQADEVIQSAIEDFVPIRCSIYEAVGKLNNSDLPVYVFLNSDDNEVQGIGFDEDSGSYELCSIGKY